MSHDYRGGPPWHCCNCAKIVSILTDVDTTEVCPVKDQGVNVSTAGALPADDITQDQVNGVTP